MNNKLDYKQFVREANSFNQQLAQERRQRLPFIDAQTGVAQSNCNLWHTESDRDRLVASESGNLRGGHLYSYPAHRWHKRRREYLMKCTPGEQVVLEQREEEPSPSHHLIERSASSSSASTSSSSQSSNHLIGAIDLPLRKSSRSLLSTATPRKQQQQQQHQPPPRADSTGSHSFVDSDSRDQSSSAASQSIAGDSPQSHHQLDDEPASHLCLGELVVPCEQQDDEVGPRDNGHEDFQNESRQPELRKTRHNLKLIERVIPLNGEQFCKEESPPRKKESGRRSRSILVKNNGHKTTQDNIDSNESKIKTEELPASCNGSHDHESLASSRQIEIDEPANLKPHVCSICDQTYKTRPGLSYHFLHAHNAILTKHNPPPENGIGQVDEKMVEKCLRKKSRTSQEAPTTRVLRNNRGAHVNNPQTSPCGNDIQPPVTNGDEAIDVVVGASGCKSPDSINSDNSKSNDTIIESEHEGPDAQDQTVSTESDAILIDELSTEANRECEQNGTITTTTIITTTNESKQNLFCDFCLGTTEKNRRTRQPEELISCSNCGSSGHPSCLQFSDNIRQSVQRYNWQCIDCKTCSACGKADHEDQLLFCDDCDRSYHTFCLSPRLENLPEGNWTCKLCLSYYYNK